MENNNEPVVLIMEHTIKKGHEKRYEKWLADVFEATKHTAGFVGREILPPGGPDMPYRTVVRFQTDEDLQNWLDSTDRDEFINDIKHILEGDKMSISSGTDLWLSKNKTPTRYKVFLISVAILFPVTQLVPKLFEPLFSTTPLLQNSLVNGLILNFVIAGLMSFILMPRVTHWLRRWVLPKSSDKDATIRTPVFHNEKADRS